MQGVIKRMDLVSKFGKQCRRDLRRVGGRTNGLDVPIEPREFWSECERKSELER